jgi:hypothetical protein
MGAINAKAAALISRLPGRGTPASLTAGAISQAKAGYVPFLAVGVLYRKPETYW